MSEEKTTPTEETVEDSTGADAVDLAAEVDAMAEEIAAAQAEAASSTDKLSEVDKLRLELHESQQRVLRVQADLENFRKRSRRDADEAIKYSALPLLRDMLPVIDNLQRAIESQTADGPAAGLLEGVKMVAHQLTDVLKQHHCHEIDADGQAFDPMHHEAVLQQESDQPAGSVIQVTQVGYRLHDRVIRPTQVIVSKGQSESGQADS